MAGNLYYHSTEKSAKTLSLVFLYNYLPPTVDDPLDAVAVHMGGGMWGLIATPLFMQGGIVSGYPEAVKVLIWNAVGLVTIIGWAGGFCFVMFGTLRVFKMLRVSEEAEIKGET